MAKTKKQVKKDHSARLMSIALYLFIIATGLNLVLIWKVISEITQLLPKLIW